VSRLTTQKGLDLVADLVPSLYAIGAKLVLLGSGDRAFEERFRWLAEVFHRQIAVRIGFDAALSRRIYAGADAFLVPSRFEPCGLTQLYAMRYGAVPIVRAVGGLRDTVSDPGDAELIRGNGTGFRFEHATAEGLHWAIERATRLFRNEPSGWRTLARAGMRRDSSWTAPAREYLQLYRAVLRDRR
jgi:starch synthase